MQSALAVTIFAATVMISCLGAFAQSTLLPPAPTGYHWVQTFGDEFNSNLGSCGDNCQNINLNSYSGGIWEIGRYCGDSYFNGYAPPDWGCDASGASAENIASGGILSMTTDSSAGDSEGNIQDSAAESGATGPGFYQRYGFFVYDAQLPQGSSSLQEIDLELFPQGNFMGQVDYPCTGCGAGELYFYVYPGNTNITQVNWGIFDPSNNTLGSVPATSTQLSNDFHQYGFYWANDGSTHGTMEAYFDGVAQSGGPWTLQSALWDNGAYFDIFGGGTDSSNPMQFHWVRAYQLQADSSGIDTSAWYEVVSKDSGYCIDDYAWGTGNGTVLDQWQCAQQSNQEWQFSQAATSGYYAISSRYASPLVVDNYGSVQNGGGVYLWSYSSGDANQEWQPQNLGNGLWRFVSLDSGMCLDNDGQVTNGTQMITWTCGDGNPNQEFTLVQEP